MNRLTKYDRIGEEVLNNQGCLMKIVEYKNNANITVQFLDEYGAKVHAQYYDFKRGKTQNPYHPTLFGVGIVGNKYSTRIKGKDQTKEYKAWHGMLLRCYYQTYIDRFPTYEKCQVCDEWLLFENFYEWLHSQSNFDKWFDGGKWCVDKDIKIKHNKVYCPDTCFLVPSYINGLFVRCEKTRGDMPIGVSKRNKRFSARCNNYLLGKKNAKRLGSFDTSEDAFYAYKEYKENVIKQVAQIEFSNKNITEECYNAMMNYEVEITD